MSAQSADDLFVTYRQAEALLAAGQVRPAADLCKQLLDADPSFAYAYHLMSALFRATGNIDKSLTFADMSLKYGPNEPLFHINQGQIWLMRGHLPAAALAFKKAHRLEPGNPLPLLLWADTKARQKKFDEALRLYQQAREARDIPEIDEHEGICLLLKGDPKAASLMFDRMIARSPQNPAGYVYKGKILVGSGNDAEAEGFFTKALALNPRAYDVLLGLAMLYYRQRQLSRAVECASQAVTIDPGNWHGHVLLGGLLVSSRDYEPAEKIFRQVLAAQPDNAYAMHGLVSVLLPQQRLTEAASYVDKALKSQPEQPVLKYFHAMLHGKTVDTAPREYVIGLFDGYADHFDHHLQQSLAYKAPQELAALMRGLPQLQGKKELSLLDLGCGTGLAAEAFRDITSQRAGVDLSSRMLEKAIAKRLYTELHQNDAVMFLLIGTRSFDIVVATDVLIYVGNMAPLMKAARNAMGAASLLGLSVEVQEGGTFKLNETGRYSHSPEYVLQVAAEEGYTLVVRQDIALRVEAEKPTRGALFIFQKTQTH